MANDEAILIRSFRVVFELERRIHRVDRFRVPLPYGLPLRSIGYAAVALLLVLVLRQLPGVGSLVDALPAPARFVLVPIALAYALTQLRIDGRPAHAAGMALLRFALAPRRVAGCRARRTELTCRLGDVALAPDESAARYRRSRIEGPATVLLRYPAHARRRGRTLELRSAGERPMWSGKRIALRGGQELRFR